MWRGRCSLVAFHKLLVQLLTFISVFLTVLVCHALRLALPTVTVRIAAFAIARDYVNEKVEHVGVCYRSRDVGLLEGPPFVSLGDEPRATCEF